MTTATKDRAKGFTKDTLAKFRGSGQEPLRTAPSSTPGKSAVDSGSGETKVTGKPVYEAFKVSKDAQRHLEIRLKFPDPAECPSNAMINNMRWEWRWGMGITLNYGTSMVVDIVGERLEPLFVALKDWKVLWLAEFDPETFSAPTDPDAPFITSIEIVTERPEPLPPMNARH